MKEYGSSVQKLVNYILTIADEEQRTKYAYLMVEVMKQIHPNMKDNTQDYTKKLWDDLYIMADFNLDVDNPFTTPDRTILFKKPRKMEYPQNDVRFRHYGKNIEKLVKEAVKKDDPKELEEAAIYLGKLMKTFYGAWNKETIDDSVIVKDLAILSQGKLVLNLDKVREENLFEKLYREQRKPSRPQGGGDNRNPRGNRPFNKKNRHNPHRRRDQ